MKSKKIFLTGILLLGLIGCDYLTYDETTDYNKDEVFSDIDRAKQFLTNIYTRVPGGFNSMGGAMRASGSDDAEEVNDFENTQYMNDGTWSAIQQVDSRWGALYYGIRASNLFLQEFDVNNFIDRQYNDNYPELIQQAKLYPYQARLLRAYFYFLLIKRYGHVPLVTNVLDVEEANRVTPSTYDEITDFIVAECDSVIPELPISYQPLPNSETGRVTRGAAMALKARALLYAASPLHNPSGDQQKWIEAARAAKDIIDLSYYSLEADYSNVVNNRTSSELIWGRRHNASNGFESSNFPVGYEGAEPGTAPTQNLVDAYEMQATGEGIDQSGSGYDPAHPYQGRDPRLEKTIITNGSTWKGRIVEIWEGGLDGPPQEYATETGYYLKKGVIEGISLDPNSNVPTAIHTWVLFRYGEVLLNYAEAMNEAYGPDDPADMGMTAWEAVNLIRDRSNMPGFPAGMSQSGFRQKLRNERRVELAFEDHRFWDLRRWKIGPSTTTVEGMKVIKNNDGSFTYQRKIVEERVWDDRMYLYPIPQSEIFKNEALQQNPGW